MKFFFPPITSPPSFRRCLLSSSSSTTLTNPLIIKKNTLQHYNDICSQYPGFIVLYQVGDFYEMYDKIAVEASTLLDMRISQKSSSLSNGPPNSSRTMAGFPISSLNSFIEKFIKIGKSIVVCDQHCLSKERKEFYRKVNRVITPGTLVDENILNRSSNNFLLCIYEDDCNSTTTTTTTTNSNSVGLAWADVSTGYFRYSSVREENLLDEISRINCTELLIPPPGLEGFRRGVREKILSYLKSSPRTQLSPHSLALKYKKDSLKSVEEQSSSFLLQYILGTHLSSLPFLEEPQRYVMSSFMHLPQTVIKSLELLENNLSGLRQNSLLKAIDRTSTSMGNRLLTERLLSPLTSVPLINDRLRKVDLFMISNTRNHLNEKGILQSLQAIKDIERAFQRIVIHRFIPSSSSSPLIRDMLIIADSCKNYLCIKSLLPEGFKTLCLSTGFLSLAEKITSSLQYSLGIGKVREGYCDILDSFKDDDHLLKERDLLISQYQKENPSLKAVFRDDGFFFTLPKSLKPSQKISGIKLVFALKNLYRYSSDKLEDLFLKLSSLEVSWREREREILQDFKDELLAIEGEIHSLSSIIAEIDFTMSVVTVSRERNFCRPTLLPINMVDDTMVVDSSLTIKALNQKANNENMTATTTTIFDVKNVKHPIVLEKNIESGRQFVGNSLKLSKSEGNFVFITGSNMGGKSTFLRQNAILAIMAQCGMYVAADSATLSIVDAIYTRIGSCDDLVNDKSTFWMEMEETAIILKNSTPNSLLLLDEIGRGTTSKEGYAIAYGIFKNISLKGSRCLFATHYLDLALESKTSFPITQRLMTGVRLLPNNDIAFLHRMEKGVALKSHAISIAKFAGVPQDVLDIAEERLAGM